jgi:hypothetical protein
VTPYYRSVLTANPGHSETTKDSSTWEWLLLINKNTITMHVFSLICQNIKGKSKVRPIRDHERPEGDYRSSSILSSNSALDGGGWLTPRTGRFTPRKESRYPMYKRLGGPWRRSGRVRKTVAPPGFDPRTVQSVASPYITLTRPTPKYIAIYMHRNKIHTHAHTWFPQPVRPYVCSCQ